MTRDAIAARRTSSSVRLLHLNVRAQRTADRHPDQSTAESRPWRELTRHCSLRPGGASLLAQTLRSEQGGDRSRAQWSRLAPPRPFFHQTHGLRRRALGCSRQGEGCTIELDSSSLAPGVGPLHRVTTPAGREEQGTSLYSSYTDPPHAPRAGSAKEATSGVSCRPASPGCGEYIGSRKS